MIQPGLYSPPRVATCAADDTVNKAMQNQLRPLCSKNKKHENLQIDGEDYNQDQIQEEGEESDEDDQLDKDGAGADVLFYVEEGGDAARSNDRDDIATPTPTPKPEQSRMSVDATMALGGLGSDISGIGRASHSSSHSSSSVRSSSMASVRSAMSIS